MTRDRADKAARDIAFYLWLPFDAGMGVGFYLLWGWDGFACLCVSALLLAAWSLYSYTREARA